MKFHITEFNLVREIFEKTYLYEKYEVKRIENDLVEIIFFMAGLEYLSYKVHPEIWDAVKSNIIYQNECNKNYS